VRESELYNGNGSNSERREGSLPSSYLKERGGDVGWPMKKKEKKKRFNNKCPASVHFIRLRWERHFPPNATEVDGA
jgi:hypothetical protein